MVVDEDATDDDQSVKAEIAPPRGYFAAVSFEQLEYAFNTKVKVSG